MIIPWKTGDKMWKVDYNGMRKGFQGVKNMNIYDIAAEAGTSISTVSRVLNNKGNVNPEMRSRVEEVLKKYDYKPSAIARGMVSKTMKSIAILTVDVRVTHYARQIYAIEQEFSKHSYNVTVCNTGGSITECEKYMEILSEKQLDGLVLIGSVFNELIHYPEITARMRDIPVVVANGHVDLPNFYSVLVDDTKGIRMAVDYLYEKGHRDILYAYDMETDSAKAKRRGFLEAMKLHDIANAERFVITCEYGLEEGKEAAKQIVKTFGMPGDDKKPGFSGIVCGEDITAIGIMKGLRSYGIRVPEDVAITGCNNSPDSLICEPEMTTLDSKPELLGFLCAQLLEQLIEGKGSVADVAIQPDLIVRGTT